MSRIVALDTFELNEYASISTIQPFNVSTNVLAYDLNGNLLTNGVWSYAYDAQNRLTDVWSNGIWVLSNAYDANARRVVKRTQEGTRYFLYDGWNLIQEYFVSSAGETNVTRYVWGKALSGSFQGAGGVGGLLAVLRDSEVFVPSYDSNGNVVAYAEGNLVYYGFRFYSPQEGRWLNRDPLLTFSAQNLYRFVDNCSIVSVDVAGLLPDGLDALLDIIDDIMHGNLAEKGKDQIDAYKSVVDDMRKLPFGETILKELIVNKLVDQLQKADLDNDLARTLINRYLYGDGTSLELSEAEINFILDAQKWKTILSTFVIPTKLDSR